MNSRERGTFCVRNSSVKLLPVLPNDKILRSLDESRSRVGRFSSCERTDLLSFFFFFRDRFGRPETYTFRSTSIASSPRESASYFFFLLFLLFLFFSSRARAIEQSEDKNYVDNSSAFAFFSIGDTTACKKEARKMDIANRFYGTRSLSPWQTHRGRASAHGNGWNKLGARIQTDVS